MILLKFNENIYITRIGKIFTDRATKQGQFINSEFPAYELKPGVINICNHVYFA